jgi:hypothetical protein
MSLMTSIAMLDFLNDYDFTMLYDHYDHEIMVMVGMIGVDGYVLGGQISAADMRLQGMITF